MEKINLTEEEKEKIRKWLSNREPEGICWSTGSHKTEVILVCQKTCYVVFPKCYPNHWLPPKDDHGVIHGSAWFCPCYTYKQDYIIEKAKSIVEGQEE